MVTIMALVGTVNNAKGQQQKIGHVDIQYVLTAMPEYKEIESQLKTLEAQLLKQSQAKEQEFQQKYQDYLANSQNMAEVVRQDKEQELQQLQNSFMEFQQNAQTSLQQKTTELLNPLYSKIGDAIDLVAQEEGYAYVFNVGVAQLDIIIYGQDETDVSNNVLRKMGIDPPAN